MGKIWSLVTDTMLSLADNTFSYTINTTIQILEQISVYREAIRYVSKDKKSQTVLDHMSFILFNDIIPMIALNAFNNKLQQTFQNDEQTELSWLEPYSYFAGSLMLVNYAVTAITWRQGIQTTIRVAALETFGPPAFLSGIINKMDLQCDTNECHLGVKLKGNVAQLITLFANDALANGIHFIPVVGPAASIALSTIFKGRFIVRSVTPGLCPQHKLPSFRFETILALGLIYQFYCWSLESALSETIGLPPYLYLRSLRHLILLLQVPFAAQKIMAMAKLNTKTEGNIIDAYESVLAFLVEAFIEGVPAVLKNRKSENPLITGDDVLQFFTVLLKADAYQRKLQPIVINRPPQTGDWNVKNLHISWASLLPPLMQGTQGVIRDPIIAAYWPGFKNTIYFIVDIAENIQDQAESSMLVKMAPKTFLIWALNLYLGAPKRLTGTALSYINDQYFWSFMRALKNWAAVHDASNQIQGVEEKKNANKSILLLKNSPEHKSVDLSMPASPIVMSSNNEQIDLERRDENSAKVVNKAGLFGGDDLETKGNVVVREYSMKISFDD